MDQNVPDNFSIHDMRNERESIAKIIAQRFPMVEKRLVLKEKDSPKWAYTFQQPVSSS